MKKSVLDLLVKLIGLVTLGIGSALAIKPEESSNALGLPYSSKWTRSLGIADSFLGLALLSGKHSRRWMHVRAAANVGLALIYAKHSRENPQQRSARLGLLMMLTISVTDAVLARSLPKKRL